MVGSSKRTARARPRRALRPSRKKVLLSIALSLAVALLATSAVAAYLYNATRTATDHVRHAQLMPTDETNDPAGVDSSDGLSKAPVNLLLMGSDSQDSHAGRSDTMILLHLDANRRAAYVISFPRDLYVPIPGHGKDKINSAYAFGGAPLAVQTLDQLLKIKIAHAAVIDFDGLVRITSELGGVTISNPYPFESHGYSYPKGQLKLSGDRALWYVRDRYQLPDGDLDRAANNRRVALAIMAKGMSGSTLRNPARFNRFVSELGDSVTVDNGFSNSEVRRLALSLRMAPSAVGQLQVPVAGFRNAPGVGSVDMIDRAKLGQLSTALRDDDLGRYARGA